MNTNTISELNISIMLSAKLILERIPKEQQDFDYKQIHCKVKQYLANHCQHTIVRDDIDVGIEESMTIYYCEKCETVFPS
jgi:hypothetical protein